MCILYIWQEKTEEHRKNGVFKYQTENHEDPSPQMSETVPNYLFQVSSCAPFAVYGTNT